MLIIFKKIFIPLILLFCFTLDCSAVNEPEISASSSILIDADTNEVLYEKNAHEQRSMASTTKIMTSLIAIESGQLKKTVTVKNKINIEGTAIGFKKGEQFTLELLCYAMLLESGNDAAVLTAEFISGSEEKFSKLMNTKAYELGMNSTNFVTSSGLDSKDHYTTAYDMALLGSYAIKNEIFREICTSNTYKAQYIQPDTTRYFSNHNRLLKLCEGVIGIKTGFTKKSGRCLVSACERNGKILVAVTLNAPDDWNDHTKLYNYGYSLYEEFYIPYTAPQKITVEGSEKHEIKLKTDNSSSVFVLNNSKTELKVTLKNIVYAPIKKNDVLGNLTVYQNGYTVREYPIYSLEDAPIVQNSKKYKPPLYRRFKTFIKNYFKGW